MILIWRGIAMSPEEGTFRLSWASKRMIGTASVTLPLIWILQVNPSITMLGVMT
jgi:hypothetical protein